MTLLDAIMSQNGCSESEAYSIIEDMVQEIINGNDPEDVLFEEGLEPDYMLELLGYAYEDESDFEFEYD